MDLQSVLEAFQGKMRQTRRMRQPFFPVRGRVTPNGNLRLISRSRRVDVLDIRAAQMETVDMVPDNPGIWLYHCHFSEHMVAGMVTRYEVKP
ncbi:MAG TPA: multicopper oxidase domain-containing protein [Terriglobia bacterium]|nr:multicopper oxidase domain-containing protein [Terriglobia bacterium]